MGIQVSDFGKTADGTTAKIVTVVNERGMGMEVTDFGAALVAVTVTDKNNALADVVLGYEDVMDYIRNTGFYLGATIGRNGNRIGCACVTINGQDYPMDDNENGNNLHSGFEGFDRKIWDMEILEDELTVKFHYHSPDGEQGLPGNFDVTVAYTLTNENEIRIHYTGTSDADTIANMTNHSYFNLAGHAYGSIAEHILWLDADAYTPVDEKLIPTGELRTVQGTPFDFRTPKKMGLDIDADDEQLKLASGYDHNYVLNHQDGQVRKVAEVSEPVTGRVMEVYTDCVGVQFYAGNFMNSTLIGKGGAAYQRRGGFCLETQYYPDANHHNHFPTSILKAGQLYDTTTIYKFTVR